MQANENYLSPVLACRCSVAGETSDERVDKTVWAHGRQPTVQRSEAQWHEQVWQEKGLGQWHEQEWQEKGLGQGTSVMITQNDSDPTTKRFRPDSP